MMNNNSVVAAALVLAALASHPARAHVCPPCNCAPGAASDDPAAELLKHRAAQSQALQELNTSNPLSEGYRAPGSQAVAGSVQQSQQQQQQQSPEMRSAIEKAQAILKAPMVQAYMKLFSSPAFISAAHFVVTHPERNTLIGAEVIWLLALLLFRAWRVSSIEHWTGRLWLKVWTFGVYAGVGLVGLPWFVFGNPYLAMIKGVVDVARTVA